MDNSYRFQYISGEWESVRRMENDDRQIISRRHSKWSNVYFLNEGYNTLTKEQSDAMYNEVYKPIDDYREEVKANNQKILREIGKVKGKAFLKNLKLFWSDFCEMCSCVENMKMELVSDHGGNETSVDGNYGREIKRQFVEQWSTGLEGDSFAGNVWLKIQDGMYLKFNYEC